MTTKALTLAKKRDPVAAALFHFSPGLSSFFLNEKKFSFLQVSFQHSLDPYPAQAAPMNARASSGASAACSSTFASRAALVSVAAATSAAARSRPLASSSRGLFARSAPSHSHLTSKSTPLPLRRTEILAVPEVADALSLVATSSASPSTFVDAIVSSSTSTPSVDTAAAAADTATSLAASIARYASAAMITLAELTNEATAAVAAEETRVAGSLAAGAVEGTTPTTTSLSYLLASLPASVFFDPPHPEPANALSLPTWAIHVSSVAEWVVAMNLFWRLGGVPAGAPGGGVPQWRGMSWGMTPLLGGALCACTFHFFYNSPALAPLVALQAGLTVVGNATMWFAAWRVFEATRGRREAEDREKEEKEKEKEKEKQQA